MTNKKSNYTVAITIPFTCIETRDRVVAEFRRLCPTTYCNLGAVLEDSDYHLRLNPTEVKDHRRMMEKRQQFMKSLNVTSMIDMYYISGCNGLLMRSDVKTMYKVYAILISHILIAATTPPFVVSTIMDSLNKNIPRTIRAYIETIEDHLQEVDINVEELERELRAMVMGIQHIHETIRADYDTYLKSHPEIEYLAVLDNCLDFDQLLKLDLPEQIQKIYSDMRAYTHLLKGLTNAITMASVGNHLSQYV